MSWLSLYELKNIFKTLTKISDDQRAIKRIKVHVLFMQYALKNIHGFFFYIHPCHASRAAFV